MGSGAEGPDAAVVADAVATLAEAMLAADRVKLEALTADQLGYGRSSGKVEDKATFVDDVASKKTVYKSIELSKQTIVVAGNDAIVRHALGEREWSRRRQVERLQDRCAAGLAEAAQRLEAARAAGFQGLAPEVWLAIPAR